MDREQRPPAHDYPDVHQLGRGQLYIRLLFLTVGFLLVGEAMLHPLLKQGAHESVERRFLRSSHAMGRKRVSPRKGPFEVLSLPGPVVAVAGPSLAAGVVHPAEETDADQWLHFENAIGSSAIAPPEPEPAAGESAHRLTSASTLPAAKQPAAAGSSRCQRLLWFMCLGPSPSAEQRRQVRAAVLSAQQHAPSLLPVLVHAGASERLADWLVGRGGVAVHHELSFLGLLKEVREARLRNGLLRHQGGFMRLDIPIVVERLVQEGMVDLHNVSASYALCTDTDVLFMGSTFAANKGSTGLGTSGEPQPQQRRQQQQLVLQQRQQALLAQPSLWHGAHDTSKSSTSRGRRSRIGGDSGRSGDITSCSIPAPQLMMLGRERQHGVPWDTGVMLVNMDALRLARPALLRFGKEAGWDFQGWEQGLLQGSAVSLGLINGFLRAHSPALEVLPDTLSWKPYWGRPAPEASLLSLSGGTLLLHWLGPKPAHARCMCCYQQNRSSWGSAWGVGCGCSRVPFKSIFQMSPDKGQLYWQALAAYEGYLERDDAPQEWTGS
ncbi:hypothetical protein N2152v2_008011 [Parachlorella kessleri]